MPTITFIDPAGTKHEIDGQIGQSLMEAATQNLVPGIIGECGGCTSCATCHAKIDAEWRARLAPPQQDELDILEGADAVDEDSRLCCQIPITEALDGIVLRVVPGF